MPNPIAVRGTAAARHQLLIDVTGTPYPQLQPRLLDWLALQLVDERPALDTGPER